MTEEITYRPRRLPLFAIMLPAGMIGVLISNALWIHKRLLDLLPLLIGSAIGLAIGALTMPMKLYTIVLSGSSVEGPIKDVFLPQ